MESATYVPKGKLGQGSAQKVLENRRLHISPDKAPVIVSLWP